MFAKMSKSYCVGLNCNVTSWACSLSKYIGLRSWLLIRLRTIGRKVLTMYFRNKSSFTVQMCKRAGEHFLTTETSQMASYQYPSWLTTHLEITLLPLPWKKSDVGSASTADGINSIIVDNAGVNEHDTIFVPRYTSLNQE